MAAWFHSAHTTQCACRWCASLPWPTAVPPCQVAVADLSLAIPRCECFGLLGPNGAGKQGGLGLIISSSCAPALHDAVLPGSCPTESATASRHPQPPARATADILHFPCAGKTTTIRIMEGFMRASGGQVGAACATLLHCKAARHY